MDDKTAAGLALLEPDTDSTQATPQAPPPDGRRPGLYWPLVALVVGALTVVGAWALTQTSDDVAEVAPRVFSDHDSLIELQLRERALLPEVRPQHDAFLGLQLREREANRTLPQHDGLLAMQLREREANQVPPQHDGLLAMQLREREANQVPPQHDSVIAAELRSREGGSESCHRRGAVDPGVAQPC